MGKDSKIGWTDNSWNPWVGCEKVSAGCRGCYAERWANDYGKPFNVVTKTKSVFEQPLKWKESAFVFTCSLSDFFIEWADEWRGEAWKIIKETPHLTYQILTKRPENIKGRLPYDWGEGYENVWLGVSVEKQEFVDRIHILHEVPAVLKFLSYEPVLGPLNLFYELHAEMLGWVISGGESGPKARPADPEWFHRVQHQCSIYKIPYFHKQNGGTKQIDGIWGGNELDGKKYEERPESTFQGRQLELC